MDSLGIDVDASDSDNMKTFNKMTVDTGVFTYVELVAEYVYLIRYFKLGFNSPCVRETYSFLDSF